jgi:TolB-like protein/Flp pilus assembly protein TadD
LIQVADNPRVVFLSYCSEDAPAARRIADALRDAGIEVWLDQSELRGGEAWDQSIRRRIRECALFLPVVSTRSESRREGYFRLEWDLADQRTHMLSRHAAFIVPVCIDATVEATADVPDSFLRAHWTRLPSGEPSASFVSRVQALLAPAPTAVADAEPAVRPAPRDHAGGAAVRARPVPRAAWAAAAAVVIAAVVAVAYFASRRPGPAASTARAAPAATSIAVLPFANESADPAQQYFSDGISEDLITALTQLPELKVIGRTSSFKLRDSREDARGIGATLGVARLLEGSVRRLGDTVRVSAELIDTTDGSTLWSERYDRPYQDLFALQDEITHAVAAALRARLLPGGAAGAQGDRPPGGSLEAYNALLQGRFLYSQRTRAAGREAIKLISKATQIDPDYAAAWSELAQALISQAAAFYGGAEARAANEQARAAADRALALAPQLAAAYVARGVLRQIVDFNWSGAGADFHRAAALAPNDAMPKFYLGNQLAALGRMEESIELTREALAIEPLRSNWYYWLAVHLYCDRQLDASERTIRRAIELEPAGAGFYEVLTVIAILRGNAPAALVAARQEAEPSWQRIALALATQVAGDPGAARAALRSVIEHDAETSAFQIAQVTALAGDAQQTFAWLERARLNRDPGFSSLLSDPFIGRYRTDPRFADYCRKLGLPPPDAAPGTR